MSTSSLLCNAAKVAGILARETDLSSSSSDQRHPSAQPVSVWTVSGPSWMTSDGERHSTSTAESPSRCRLQMSSSYSSSLRVCGSITSKLLHRPRPRSAQAMSGSRTTTNTMRRSGRSFSAAPWVRRCRSFSAVLRRILAIGRHLSTRIRRKAHSVTARGSSTSRSEISLLERRLAECL